MQAGRIRSRTAVRPCGAAGRSRPRSLYRGCRRVAGHGNLMVGGDPNMVKLADDPERVARQTHHAAIPSASSGPALRVRPRAAVQLGNHLILVRPAAQAAHPACIASIQRCRESAAAKSGWRPLAGEADAP